MQRSPSLSLHTLHQVRMVSRGLKSRIHREMGMLLLAEQVLALEDWA